MDGDRAAASTASTAGRWWAPPANACPPTSTDVMNQLCRVCGEPAAGFHFGAFTCEGCKSFFGRTYNNLSSISECKNNNECVINKKNRTSCKACRLRKCLMVGMSKSGSRYGRRSNWFKIHCLLQEQQHSGVNSISRDSLASNNKVLPSWESINQNFSEKHHHHHHMPAMMDADNNNTSHSKSSFLDVKERMMTPNDAVHKRVGTLPQQHMGYANPGEAAAAFWAARSSLLPLHPSMNPGSLGPLPVPFLAAPFLHSATGFPHSGPPPRNFILPFVQSIANPRHNDSVQRLLSTTASSVSSTDSSPSSSPVEKRHTLTSEQDRETDSIGTDRSSKDQESISETSIEVFRALGPVQDHPIDLSVKSASLQNKARHKRKCSKSSNEKTDSEDCDSETGKVSCDGDDESDKDDEKNVDKDSKAKKVKTVPLDLTTR